MKRVTRREAKWWLEPYRRALVQHRNGIDYISDGELYMRTADDQWIRFVDAFIGLAMVVERMMPGIDLKPFDTFLSAIKEGDDAPTGPMELVLNDIENRIIKLDKLTVYNASVTEEIAARMAQEYDSAPSKDVEDA